MSDKNNYAIISPKSENGKKRLLYHGEKWILKRETTQPYNGAEIGKWFGIISRDGKAFLWIKEIGDKDFDIRLV